MPHIRLVPRMSNTAHKQFDDYKIYNIATSEGTVKERAEQENCSTRTVYKVDKRMREEGTPYAPQRNKAGRHSKMSDLELAQVFWIYAIRPSITIPEIVKFLDALSPTNKAVITESTISKAVKRLELTEKRVQHVSFRGDELDRTDYQCNGLDDPIRPGIMGMDTWDYVCLDEFGRSCSSSNSNRGHSLCGTACRQLGREPREEAKLTGAVAVDRRVGTVARLIYPGGTSNDKFLFFVEFFLIPALKGTNKRVIGMDRLSAHFGEAKLLLEQNGHIVIMRPSHSCDFAPVEWVFHFVDTFLRHSDHQSQINPSNFKSALEAALDCVTPADVAGYMACAHMVVPGHTFKPYLG
jgi:transposase